jgi:hypothetical protein
MSWRQGRRGCRTGRTDCHARKGCSGGHRHHLCAARRRRSSLCPAGQGCDTRTSASFEQWLQKSTFAILAALIGVVAPRARSAWLDTATAIALAVLAAIFMVNNLRGFSV